MTECVIYGTVGREREGNRGEREREREREREKGTGAKQGRVLSRS